MYQVEESYGVRGVSFCSCPTKTQRKLADGAAATIIQFTERLNEFQAQLTVKRREFHGGDGFTFCLRERHAKHIFANLLVKQFSSEPCCPVQLCRISIDTISYRAKGRLMSITDTRRYVPGEGNLFRELQWISGCTADEIVMKFARAMDWLRSLEEFLKLTAWLAAKLFSSITDS